MPDGAWQPPVPSAPSRFRNKAKMAVAGTAALPTLGILDGAGHGVDLRSCPLHETAIEEALPLPAVEVQAVVPYDRGDLVSAVHEHGIILSQEHGPDGTFLHAHVPAILGGRLAAYAV